MKLSMILVVAFVLSGCSRPWYSFDGTRYNSHAAAHEAQDKYYGNILENIRVREEGPFSKLELNVVDYSFSEGKRGVKLRTRHSPISEDAANYLTKTQMGDWDNLIKSIKKANLFNGVSRTSSRHRIDTAYPRKVGAWTLTYKFIAGLGEKIVLTDPMNGVSNFSYSTTATSGYYAFENMLDQITAAVKSYGAAPSAKEGSVNVISNKHTSNPSLEDVSNVKQTTQSITTPTLRTAENGDVFVSSTQDKIPDQRMYQKSSSSKPGNTFKPTKSNSKNWTLSTDIDPITDAKVVVAQTQPVDGGSSRRTQALLVRCDAGDIDIFVSFDDYLGDTISVISRIDSKEPVNKRWTMSSNSQAAFYPSKTKKFLKELMEAERFVVRATPYNESPITLVFDVSGLFGRLVKYKKECFSNVLTKYEIESNDSGIAKKVQENKEPAKKVESNAIDSRFLSSDPAKEAFSVPASMIENRINSDDSADGIKFSIKLLGRQLAVDLLEIPSDTSMASIIRVVMMIGRLTEKSYDTMIFNDQDSTVFKIHGKTIQNIGRQFVWGEANKGQNPIALIRMFAKGLRTANGDLVAYGMNGSLLGDTSKAMNAINDRFHREWSLKTYTQI